MDFRSAPASGPLHCEMREDAAQLALQPDHQLVEQLGLERRDTMADFDHAGAKGARAMAFHVLQQPFEERLPRAGETAFAFDMMERGLRVVMREIDFHLRFVVDENRLRGLAQRAQEMLASFGRNRVNLARAPAIAARRAS